jgi:hypothetical protein
MNQGERRGPCPGRQLTSQGIVKGTMAMASSQPVSHQVEPFRLSRHATRVLHSILGESAASVAPQLQTLIRDHVTHNQARRALEGFPAARGNLLTGGTMGSLLDYAFRPVEERRTVRATTAGRKRRAEVKRIMTALRTVIREIDATSAETQRRLQNLRTLADIGSGQTLWKRLAAVRQNAAHVLPLLGTIRGRRGRPRNFDRYQLAFEVALLLHFKGIRVATSRDGDFGRVLAAVASEVYGDSTPEDLFPLIKDASHRVRDLKALPFLKLMRCVRNASFWSQFQVQ